MTEPASWAAEEALRRLLYPGGNPIGNPGKSSRIRRLPGDLFDARALFNELAQLGVPDDTATYPGNRVKIAYGLGYVGIRNVSGSGEPTVDVDVNIGGAERIKKIKFLGWPE